MKFKYAFVFIHQCLKLLIQENEVCVFYLIFEDENIEKEGFVFLLKINLKKENERNYWKNLRKKKKNIFFLYSHFI